jgi:prepilin-type N-terminal cleavage/methylation domain-containing protein
MKLLRRMNKSNNRKNSGFTLVELVIVMAIMGILGLAVVGFIGTSTKQYKYASKDVDLQYEAQLTMNQIGDLIIDAQKGVKYEPATVAAPVEVASVNPEAGYIATASAEEASSEEASSEETSSDSKLIIYNKDCTYNIIYRPSEHKIYLRKDTLDPATGAVKADGQGKESLMAENVTGFTPDLSEAESKNSVGLVVDFKAGDKKYTSKQNFTMRNKVPTGADVEYVAPAEPISVHIYYGGRDVSTRTIFMDSGYVAEDAAPSELFTNPKNPRTREFLSRYLAG